MAHTAEHYETELEITHVQPAYIVARLYASYLIGQQEVFCSKASQLRPQS